MTAQEILETNYEEFPDRKWLKEIAYQLALLYEHKIEQRKPGRPRRIE
jgi:hypothetical protein